jgi:hypothetical protein
VGCWIGRGNAGGSGWWWKERAFHVVSSSRRKTVLNRSLLNSSCTRQLQYIVCLLSVRFAPTQKPSISADH